MNRLKIRNKMHMSVFIEDLGVHLPCFGSEAIVNAESFHRSRDAQKLKAWIAVELLGDANMPPVWPFSARRRDQMQPKLDIKPEKVDVKPNINQKSPDIERLAHALEEQNKIWMKLLESKSTVLIPELSSSNVNMIQNSTQNFKKDEIIQPDAPIFIPSKISPDSFESNIKTQEQDVHINLDDSREAIRRMRKKS